MIIYLSGKKLNESIETEPALISHPNSHFGDTYTSPKCPKNSLPKIRERG
jgi:hypothetical protein